MGLTATATESTLSVVIDCLAMCGDWTPSALSKYKYAVKPFSSVNEFCITTAAELIRLGLEYPKTVIFCRKYTLITKQNYIMVYGITSVNTSLFPPGSPDFHEFRLMDMYTRASTIEIQELVLKSFTTAGCKLRIVYYCI